MSKKNLIPLFVILAILVGLVVVKSMTAKAPSIVDQVQLVSLLPEGLSSADVAKLELFSGAHPDERVVLTRDEGDPNVWRVTSHFDAPAQAEKIEGFVDTLVGLKGEFRATADTDEALEEYRLSDEKAFHVLGFMKGSEEAGINLLVGKAPASNQVLMRTVDGKDVFVLDQNLRREAGVWQDDSDEAPGADSWLDKKIVELDKDKVCRIETTGPDKRVVFERHEKEGEPAAEAADETEGEEGEESEEPAPPAEPAKEYEWVLAEGGPGGEYKQSGLDSLLRAFSPLNATTIVDPAKKAEWGLDTPAFGATITIEGQDEPVVLEGGRPTGSDDGYVRVAGAAADVVYKLSKWQFERVFPKGQDLFQLAGLAVDKQKVDRVELVQPEGNIVLVKGEGGWTVQEPAVALDVQRNTLDTIANTLAAWQPADYADSAGQTGLDASTRRVTFTAGPDESHTVVFGADSKGIDGVYARLDGSEAVLVMSRSDVDRVLVAPKDLYERTLLDLIEDDVQTVTVARAEDGFQLSRAEGGWKLAVAGEEFDADEDAAEAVAQALADLQASDIRFGTADLGADAAMTLTCVALDGTESVFRFGEEAEGVRPLVLSGKDVVFEVASADVAAVAPASESLKKPEPEPEPEPAPEATPAGEGAAEAAAPAAPAAAPAAPAAAPTE
ncbi:MAG: DUF4340 domain-containing protein [Candidatus Hydrogenedentes bacterium]|nr:DUF4340 domain-containing protein [Candidatus Hydrogenedentota bacterium]